jgi:drug/metabolite transporter (DMT)-like permease
VLKPLTLVIGVFLAAAGTRIAFWAGRVTGTNSAVGHVALALAVMILLAAMGVLLQGISKDTAIPRRIALLCLAAAALISAIAALTLSMLIDGDPLSVFFFGVFVAALFAAPAAFLKAIRLEELVEPAPLFDPYDPGEPPDPMIEPEPGPTLALLLARKRSLNLAPRRGT